MAYMNGWTLTYGHLPKTILFGVPVKQERCICSEAARLPWGTPTRPGNSLGTVALLMADTWLR
jgi:hypothetical protein